MKVIKRDGRIVDYDKSKIKIAVEKANTEVTKKEKASLEDIKAITEYIEELGKKRILVEDIQDIIEKKLMELGKYELAKKYIVYRYTRALVRKSNTTDESILGLIRSGNRDITENNLSKNAIIASTQRDLIAGEVSKDLSKRILLPEKIINAWEEGVLFFHDSEYFIQPIINSCIINIEDMLDNGTVMNGKMIDSPKGFQVACIVFSQIIATIASNQYGEQYIDMKCLGKYLRKSKEKYKKEIIEELGESFNKKIIDKLVAKRLKSKLSAGVQTIQYQINTLTTTNGHAPIITLFLHIDSDDEYIEENAMIIEEILKQRIQGIKNSEGEYFSPDFPKLVYVLDECNNLTGGKYDYLTKLAVECSIKRMSPNYISAKKMKKIYERNIIKSGKGSFDQGIVTINLPQIAITAEKDEKKFWELLDERLELCKEALMCRHYALVGTSADASPIHWRYGAIARLNQGEKIDKLLYGENSTISLGYIGIYEMTKMMKGVSHFSPEGHNFAIKVIQYMKDKIQKWKKENNIGFSLYSNPSDNLCYEFAKIDKELFGTIEEITDKGYYTNSYQLDKNDKIDVLERLKFEAEFHKLSDIELFPVIETLNVINNVAEIELLIKYIYENF